jgi:DNA-binding MarR family transcriptional regulator
MATTWPSAREDPRIGQAIQDLRRVVKAIEDYSRSVEHRFGLTGPQVWALWEMAMGGPMSLKDLAARMDMESSTLVGVIDRLLLKELVVRTQDTADRRQVSLFPSPRGWDLLAEAPHPAQGYLLHGLRRLSPRHIQELRRSLRLLVRVLEAENLDPPFFFGDPLALPHAPGARRPGTPPPDPAGAERTAMPPQTGKRK